MAVYLVVHANPYSPSNAYIRLYDEVSPFAIGRSPEVPILLQAAAVSRRHAELRVHNKRLAIRDIGSTNGLRTLQDHPLQPFVWMEMNHLPIDMIGYHLSAEWHCPVSPEIYHTLGDPLALLNYLPGPQVQTRLMDIEALLTRTTSPHHADPHRSADALGSGCRLPVGGVFDSLPENLRESPGTASSLLPVNGRLRLLLTQQAELTELYRQPLVDLFRDVLGDFLIQEPICPTVCAWRGGLIPCMARTIEEEGCFEDLPILADALEEAGCENLEVLTHLRGPRPHYRGCWALRWLTARPSLVPAIQSL